MCTNFIILQNSQLRCKSVLLITQACMERRSVEPPPTPMTFSAKIGVAFGFSWANLSSLENCANEYESVENQFDEIGDKIKVLPISIKHSKKKTLKYI